MVYGSTLHLPGEFFTPSLTTSLPDPSEFLNQLRTHFRTTSPILPRPTQRTTHIADGLSKATHVLVHHDAVRKPLQPPYDGPFPVVKRIAKHFTNCEKSSGNKTTFFCGSTTSSAFIDAYRFVIFNTSVKHLMVVGSSLRKQEKCAVPTAIAWLVQVKHVHTQLPSCIIQINVEYLPTTKHNKLA